MAGKEKMKQRRKAVLTIRTRKFTVKKSIKLETMNAELFLSIFMAAILENLASGTLSFRISALFFFLASFAANVLLTEILFRIIKVTKNGKESKV